MSTNGPRELHASGVIPAGRLYSCHAVEEADYWEYEPHFHVDCCDLTFLYRGRMEQQVNGARAVLDDGAVTLVRPGDTHRVRSRGLVMFTLNFAVDPLRRAARYLEWEEQVDAMLDAPTAPVVSAGPVEQSMLLREYQALLYGQTEEGARRRFAAFLVRWLVEVVSTAEPSPSQQLPAWLAHLIEFIEDNVESPVSVGDLPHVCGRSSAHIARTFREYLGTTPSAAVNQARMNRAALLLAHTNRSILDICFALGFNSASYFYRLFRAAFGVAPHRYRVRHSLYRRLSVARESRDRPD